MTWPLAAQFNGLVSTMVLFSSRSLRSVSRKCPLSVDTKPLIVVGECGFHEKPCVGICRDSFLWPGVWLSGRLKEWTVLIPGRGFLIWETMNVSVCVSPVTPCEPWLDPSISGKRPEPLYRCGRVRSSGCRAVGADAVPSPWLVLLGNGPVAS